MPNFIAKKIKELNFPFRVGETEFLSLINGRKLDLIHTKSFDSEFFITLKPSGDKFIIKGEKVSKPAKIGHLQKALQIFKDEFCDEIVSESFAFKNKSLIEKTTKILDENEVLNLIKAHKFSKIFIEIGFGSGRHLLFQARQNSDTLVIGIEIYKPAIEQVAKLAIKENLQNVALINTDARILLSMIDSNLIDKIFLHFPVPWDDAPHRRVISHEFAKECVRTLKIGGKFELRTDSELYFEFAKEIFGEFSEFGKSEFFKNQNLQISSKYEDRWKKMDKDIFDFIFENSQISDDLKENFVLKFPKFNKDKIYKNFTNEAFKGDDFFVHFEEIYKNDEKIFIRVSLGAFDLPQQCYLAISDDFSSYFIKFPLAVKQTYKAHKKVTEILEKWQCSI